MIAVVHRIRTYNTYIRREPQCSCICQHLLVFAFYSRMLDYILILFYYFISEKIGWESVLMLRYRSHHYYSSNDM